MAKEQVQFILSMLPVVAMKAELQTVLLTQLSTVNTLKMLEYLVLLL